MSTRIATDGARITVGPDDLTDGHKLTCSICGYVMSDSGKWDSLRYVEENADGHESWHNAGIGR